VDQQAQALDELRTKTLCDVHRETAIKWAWRGWAACFLWMQHPGATWRDDAIEYTHEAIEHAALVGDDFAVLRRVRKITQGLETDETALQAALAELHQKSLAEIQKETALLWAYRAWAAYQLKLTADAVDYEQEALEHAALSGADDVLVQVRAIVKS